MRGRQNSDEKGILTYAVAGWLKFTQRLQSGRLIDLKD